MRINPGTGVIVATLWLMAGCAGTREPAPEPASIALLNGQWFNGASFESRPMYSVGGRLETRRPAHIDRSMDLAGGYVVPPFCEAHNHNLPVAREQDNRATIARYLSEGIFYVQITGNLSDFRDRHAALFNHPESVDVTFANGGLTASGGHPTILVRDVLLPQGWFPGETLESLRNRRYFIIDDAAALEREWPVITGQRPDFIKAFLEHSEEYEQRRDVDIPLGLKGLNPALAPEIVRRAHAAGLRAMFHVDSAADFHVALAAGADQILHFPGLLDGEPVPEADMALAAQRRIPVHTTVALLRKFPVVDQAAGQRRSAAVKANLQLARRLGVNLVAGSDAAEATSRLEIDELRKLGIFPNAELLAMWGERCAQAVFPARKVGRLEAGYEASFLVLQGDPLADFDNTRRISRAMKDGRWLQLPAMALAQAAPQPRVAANIALLNGQWFDGKGFERRQVYSVDGRFTFNRPARIDQTLDLHGAWVVPPFADAHSHSLGQGIPGADAKFARGYLDAGVFYVQSQGNLPLSAAEKAAMRLNTPAGLDIAFSNGSLTSRDSGLHAFLAGVVLPQGAFRGYTLAALNNVRYFEIDSAEELQAKWPLVLAQQSDFIKTFLWLTDNAPFQGPPFLQGKHALAPAVFREIVRQAHASGLRVSAHVISAGDFRVAVEGGADEIAHMASSGVITPELAKLAASRRVAVVTTMGQAAGPPQSLPPAMREGMSAMLAVATRNLKTLVANGVNIVIGADTPADTSVTEAAYLHSLGLFDNAAMLRMWGTATPLVIFPDRKIGALKEGYEASFLALDADPLADWSATRKIRMRFKQGLLLDPAPP